MELAKDTGTQGDMVSDCSVMLPKGGWRQPLVPIALCVMASLLNGCRTPEAMSGPVAPNDRAGGVPVSLDDSAEFEASSDPEGAAEATQVTMANKVPVLDLEGAFYLVATGEYTFDKPVDTENTKFRLIGNKWCLLKHST